ncbi:LysR family substrate-binding domain-containing protein [Georgenia sp. TF02-10]|uniref:LysR family substrate-binding domain-containing protein n=1 Tax=Georgenia sp. TF02-10 TaxID=2917725 RepID=UPI001FA6D858|nr:LysR family substrate-binding domain-containing protein [Georgenia sp. TF02-10]UNX53703.1 LysR family substrate-binding domain-containing protein [Georgenia sp. TF02-10]
MGDGEGRTPGAEPFRIRFVPGVTPDRWLRTWARRMPGSPLEAAPVTTAEQVAVLRSGEASMSLVRLPVDRAGLHVIPLYREVPVVVAAKEHPVAAFEEVDVADLAEEHLLQDPADVPEWRAVAREVRDGGRAPVAPMSVPAAVEVAASGAGILILPMSLARLHHRRDVVHRPVTGVAPSEVGLAWLAGNEDPRVETFVGIVRGRTERSSRGNQPPSPAATGTTAGREQAATAGREQAGRAPARRARPGRAGRPGGRGGHGRRRPR